MANTTNLNLEKPIGTDQALVSVINSNMDKIDTFAGSTNQALSNKFANLGTLSASTESDFFTAVVNQIKTYANGTYVFSATWQSNSAYIITASKVSNTRIIGSAVPQMQTGKDMVGFSYEGTTLNLYPLALKGKALTVIDEKYVNANSSATFTLSSVSEVGFLYANNGNGTEYAWVVGARNNNELGISPIVADSQYITITKSGLSFTVACTYATRVQFVKGAN